MKTKQVKKDVYYTLGDPSNGMTMGDHYKTYKDAMIGISCHVKKFENGKYPINTSRCHVLKITKTVSSYGSYDSQFKQEER